jgi:hypothetical protein
VIGLLRFGSIKKFYEAPFFLVNLVVGFLGSERDVPEPEKAV